MTAREMQIEFERRVQLISEDLRIDNKIPSDTIFSFLNDAQDRFVKLNYVGDDQTVTETNTFARNVDAIKSLVTIQHLSSTGLGLFNYVKFALPIEPNIEYFLYINSASEIIGTYKGNTESGILPNDLIKYGDLDSYITTAHNTPIITRPAVILTSDPYSTNSYATVISDKYTNVQKLVLVYYRKPKRFNVIKHNENVVDICELPESVHSEIVDLAVEMFITETKYRLNVKQPEEQQ